jgi:hypothetical protein
MGQAVAASGRRRDAEWRAQAWPLLRRAAAIGILALLLAYAWQQILGGQRRVAGVTLFAAAVPAGGLPALRRRA